MRKHRYAGRRRIYTVFLYVPVNPAFRHNYIPMRKVLLANSLKIYLWRAPHEILAKRVKFKSRIEDFRRVFEEVGILQPKNPPKSSVL